MAHILFITSNRIGDAVLSTAALAAARAQAPGATLTVVCGPLAAPLFRAEPGLKRIILLEKTSGRWMRLWSELRSERFDLAVDLRGSLVTYGLNCGRRIVHRKSGKVQHKVEELAALMGVSPPPSPGFAFDDAARQAARSAAPGDGPILALGPGTNWFGKQWAPARFAAAAQALAGPGGTLAGARVALLGGPGDEVITAEIAPALTGIETLDLAGKLDLLGNAALLARARLFIGNDSGLMHIAAAAGAPTLGLFGPSDERVYGPWGPKAASLRGEMSYEEGFAHLDFYKVEKSLMDGVEVEAVIAAANALLQGA